MAKLKIFTFPDVVLTQKSVPVPRVEKTFFKLADDMLETMYDAPGIGLAANQVGLLERFIVIDTEYDAKDVEDLKEGEKIPENAEVINGQIITGKKPLILINPEIIYREGKNAIEEGCLSVPEYWAEVERAEKIKVRYQTIDGLEKILAVDDVLAICIQHEIDHLEGKLFIERLSALKKEFAKKKLLKARKEKERKLGLK
jgi:peptide deformylase